VPDIVLLPDHAPLAVHDVAFVLDQLNVEDPPDAIVAGAALNVTVGDGALATVTVTLRVIEFRNAEHRNVNVLVALNGPTFSEPDVGRLPDQAPDAEHRLALVVDQLSIDCAPGAMLVGVAPIESEGRVAPMLASATNGSKQPSRSRQTARAFIWSNAQSAMDHPRNSSQPKLFGAAPRTATVILQE
jgi:hypothetical protein